MRMATNNPESRVRPATTQSVTDSLCQSASNPANLVHSGRICIAGLNEGNVERVAQAFAAALD
jgi:aspartate/tyrosine/aromatic aminotransferase